MAEEPSPATLADALLRIDQLEEALSSRTDIGIAIGITMERYSIDQERAFASLSRLSQAENRKLRDLAADVVAGRPISEV